MSRFPRSSLHGLARIAALLVVPPVVSSLALVAAWHHGGGKAGCFAGLDLDTPGLVCSAEIFGFLSALFVSGAHLLVVFPASLWAGHRIRAVPERRATTRRIWGAVSCLVVVVWAILLVASLPGVEPRVPESLGALLLYAGEFIPYATDACLAFGLLLLFAGPFRASAPEQVAAGDVRPSIVPE